MSFDDLLSVPFAFAVTILVKLPFVVVINVIKNPEYSPGRNMPFNVHDKLEFSTQTSR